MTTRIWYALKIDAVFAACAHYKPFNFFLCVCQIIEREYVAASWRIGQRKIYYFF